MQSDQQEFKLDRVAARIIPSAAKATKTSEVICCQSTLSNITHGRVFATNYLDPGHENSGHGASRSLAP
jgi:hypothetical protein